MLRMRDHANSAPAMGTIPRRHTDELDLHQLRVLDALFREHSLTRAAEALNTNQPRAEQDAGPSAPVPR